MKKERMRLLPGLCPRPVETPASVKAQGKGSLDFGAIPPSFWQQPWSPPKKFTAFGVLLRFDPITPHFAGSVGGRYEGTSPAGFRVVFQWFYQKENGFRTWSAGVYALKYPAFRVETRALSSRKAATRELLENIKRHQRAAKTLLEIHE